MGIGQALIIAASGFLTVFLMLVLLWVIIGVINKGVSGFAATEAAPAAPVKTMPEEETVPVRDLNAYGGELAVYGDMDDKTIACIMAIVSDETKIPLNQLIFRSIREVQ